MQAETSDNVQLSNVSFYNRAEDAKACQITSTVLLPVFSDPGRSQAVAVLEITQFRGSKTSYQAVFNWSRTYLEEVGTPYACCPTGVGCRRGGSSYAGGGSHDCVNSGRGPGSVQLVPECAQPYIRN